MNKNRIIINIESSVNHQTALNVISKIIARGFESETASQEHYSHLTSFTTNKPNEEIWVRSAINKVGTTYTFNVYKCTSEGKIIK